MCIRDRVEAARMKFLATPEEKNPNMRFVNNRFIEQLRNCDDYKDYHEKKPVTWTNEPEFLRDFSERIVKSELYKEYMDSSDDSYENLSLIHISEPTRQAEISYAVFCLKKKKSKQKIHTLRMTITA